MLYTVVAFNDNVGKVCGLHCGNAAVADITADYGEDADAGLDPVITYVPKDGDHCMGCGRNLANNNAQEG